MGCGDMVKRTLWIDPADDNERGSFCDRESGHEYQNVDNFGAVSAARSAEESGTEVLNLDAPIFDDQTPNSDDLNQRYNLYYSDQDGRSLPTPSKYEPGR